MRNSEIKFKDRIYADFNLEIKRIRLRETLDQILVKPDIYLRTKVPENISETLIKLNEIRKQWNMRTIQEFNLFPQAQVISPP